MSDPSRDPLEDASLRETLGEIAATERLLCALDFDGTLAPEVDDPSDARALPEARTAVFRMLDAPHTRVALVSGRAITSLVEVTDLPDSVLLIGSHGVEIRLDDGVVRNTLSDEEREKVIQLGNVLERVAAEFDGVWIEPKPAGYALHTRRVNDDDSRAAHHNAMRETGENFHDLTMRRGKNVLEFSVRSTTKGDAVEQLRLYTDATAVFYAGDDVTDEDVFAVLGRSDMGLKSGPGATSAGHRVPGPHEVAHTLELLAKSRAEAMRGQAT